MGQLDGDVVGAEPLDQPAQLAAPGRRPVRSACRTAPLRQPVSASTWPAVSATTCVQVVDRAALLRPAQLGGADRAAERPVAVGIAGQQQQVAALRVGHPVLRGGQPERELGAEHRGHAQLGGGLGEPHHPVHAVVVGEREGLQTQPGGLLDQLLGVAGAVQEAEVGVAVQLGVGHRGSRGPAGPAPAAW